MIDPLDNVRTLDLDGDLVSLDPKRLSFNEASLSGFMEELSVWYDYYSSRSAKAEELAGNAETAYEAERDKKFLEGKSQGLSDKAAEAFSRIDDKVKLLLELTNKYKGYLKQLKEYTKALDKAHSMSQNRGYMLRKEMDKLNPDIRFPSQEKTLDEILN